MKQFNDIELENPTEYGIMALAHYYPQVQQMEKQINNSFFKRIFQIIYGLILRAKNQKHQPKYWSEFLEFMENKNKEQ